MKLAGIIADEIGEGDAFSSSSLSGWTMPPPGSKEQPSEPARVLLGEDILYVHWDLMWHIGILKNDEVFSTAGILVFKGGADIECWTSPVGKHIKCGVPSIAKKEFLKISGSDHLRDRIDEIKAIYKGKIMIKPTENETIKAAKYNVWRQKPWKLWERILRYVYNKDKTKLKPSWKGSEELGHCMPSMKLESRSNGKLIAFVQYSAYHNIWKIKLLPGSLSPLVLLRLLWKESYVV